VVGGLVVAVSSSMAKANPNLTVAQKLKPHLFFNLGRLMGFSILGAVIGWLGSMISLTPAWNGALVILIALMMILIGINLLDVFPQSFNPIRPPKWLAHKIHMLSSSPKPETAFLLGALTFFLPCGFTQSMQLYAVSLADPAQAALVMFVFALGTLPALLFIGAITAASRGKTLQLLTRAAGAFVIVLGISNVQNGAALLDVRLPGRIVSQDMGAAVLVDGKQLLQMEVTPYGIYSPDVLTVTEGIPVRWEIWGANVMGCASNLVLPAFGVDTVLEPGDNTVEFTPDRSGTFTYSCSMGMVRGTMIVEPQS